MPTSVDLADVRTFVQRFVESTSNMPDLAVRDGEYTTWFGECMQTLAKSAGLECQNLQIDHAGRAGEWMALDHVIVRSRSYDAFPLVVIEHENRDMSPDSKAGAMPHDRSLGAFIEWAFWKVLAVRSHLGVLVAYPWKRDQRPALAVFTRMVDGFYRQYGELPPVLLLVRWWPPGSSETPSNVGTPFEAYAPSIHEGTVTLAPIAMK